jgi:arylsulfatase A-like enzyme
MGDWKAVRMNLHGHLELYDLRSDPGEQHDVAASQPEVVARIERYLLTARTDSPLWPIPSRWQSWKRRAPRMALALLAISGLACIAVLGGRAFLRRSARRDTRRADE